MIRPGDVLTAFDLPPKEAVAYLQQKGYAITWDWSEMLDRAHRQAFTVAKAMQADVLQDIRDGVQSALDNGDSLGKFKKNLKPLLEAKGWWGKVEQTNPATGKTQKVQAGSPWRLETIYRTNVQSAYQAGRYQQQQAAAASRPFWQYLSVSDNRSRPSHGALNGMVLPADHEFWSTNYPPNGFRCRCRVTTYTKKGLERAGLRVEPGQVNFTPDKGFNAAPTESWKPDTKRYHSSIGKQLQMAFDGELKKNPPRTPKPTAKPGEQEYVRFADSLTGFSRLAKREREVVNTSIDHLSKLIKAKRFVVLAAKFSELAPGARRQPGVLGAMVAYPLDARLWMGRDYKGVDQTPEQMRSTFYHEYGHVLDLGAKDALEDDPDSRLKHRVNYEKLSDTFSRTQAFKNNAPLSAGYKAYIQSPHEVFARAFAQYVAEKTDPGAYESMFDEYAVKLGIQWSKEDFAPIRDFVEQELKRLELSVD